MAESFPGKTFLTPRSFLGVRRSRSKSSRLFDSETVLAQRGNLTVSIESYGNPKGWQVGERRIAIVADVQLEGEFATHEDAWDAVDRFWTERREREQVEGWKRET
jgi:hypothetical protein